MMHPRYIVANPVPLPPQSSACMSPPQLRLFGASQPDIVRSTQKDALYMQQTIDACHDVVRRFAGSFPALQYGRETELVASLLYHCLTTGCGLQTLGEEYCNMMQVNASGRSPGLPRRAALVLCRSLGPYLTDALTAHLARLQQQQDQQQDQQQGQQQQQQGAGQNLEEQSARVQTRHASGQQQQQQHPAQAQGREAGQQDDPDPQPPTNQLLGGAGGRPHPLAGPQASHLPLALPLLQGPAARLRQLPRAQLALAAVWPRLHSWLLGPAARLHLALFYVWGVYYNVAHRLAGVRYITTAQPLAGRTSYRALGVLLMVQLVVSGYLQLQRYAQAFTEQHQRQQLLAAASHAKASVSGPAASCPPASSRQDLSGGADKGIVGRLGTKLLLWLGAAQGPGAAPVLQHALLLPEQAQYEGADGDDSACASPPSAAAPALQQSLVPVLGAYTSGRAQGGKGLGEQLGQGQGLGQRGSTRLSSESSEEQEADDGVLVRHPSRANTHLDCGGNDVGPGSERGSPLQRNTSDYRETRPPLERFGGTSRPLPVQAYVPVVSGRQCPLCLSARRHPTSTPCGHVFCWQCVAQWCTEKPECPLCRANVIPPQLVPLYHTTLF